MTPIRSKAIVAVFGGDDADAVGVAMKLGGVIAGRRILLTGGTRAGAGSVKESAIAGVGSSPWIGVERAKAISTSEPGSGFIVYSDLNHKRNYLEACLCDAAVGLTGGDGTVSEVTFALSLRRPVAFVGDQWTRDGLLGASDDSLAKEAMVKRAFDRVKREPSGRPDLDALLNESVIRDGLERLPPYKHFSYSATPDAMIAWIDEALSSVPLRGGFPPLKGYERVIAAYQKWLERYAV